MRKHKKKPRRYTLWVGGVFTLLIIGFTLVVWWKEKSGGACYEQNSTQSTVDYLVPPLIVKSIPDNQYAPQQANKPAASSENYLCRLITPANLPNIYLVLIGFGGVLAAIGPSKSLRVKLSV